MPLPVGKVCALDIPELLDLIIDHLSDSTQDLRLFAPEADRRAVARLAAAFVRAPHLADLVRIVEVSLDRVLLAALASAPLSRLREVTLHCSEAQRRARADVLVIADVRRLLRNGKVLLVCLDGDFPSVSVLNAYFAGCSRSIVSIKGLYYGEFVERYDAGDDEGENEELNDKNVAPKLNLVALCASTAFGIWLCKPSCPFLFSSLVMVVVPADFWLTLRSLAGTLHNLAHLKLVAFEDSPVIVDEAGTAPIDLSGLPLLRRLEFSFPQTSTAAALRVFVRALQSLPPGTGNRVTMIEREIEYCMRLLDAQLAELAEKVLRALVRVEFDLPLLKRRSSTPRYVSLARVSNECFETWLPRISAKGWLDIQRRPERPFIALPACQ
ncbi:hypothetical protein GGX14DRAFT_453826 [Mycena pura]|uniref:Uncharacterized protein n=1 Tax=Mycena pura TaxID=153505 RepID=A0AAD6VDU9_9AGAR|nr:hypothetical protein GGX14DRAFT_453826 [Mycena pura]